LPTCHRVDLLRRRECLHLRGKLGHYRAPCLEILEATGDGQVEGRTSTAVLEAVWHVELSGRTAVSRGLARYAHALMAPLLPVTEEAFALALTLNAPALGANDRLHVGTCLAHGIALIVSADRGFDRVAGIRRLDPLDDAGRRELLGSAVTSPRALH